MLLLGTAVQCPLKIGMLQSSPLCWWAVGKCRMIKDNKMLQPKDWLAQDKHDARSRIIVCLWGGKQWMGLLTVQAIYKWKIPLLLATSFSFRWKALCVRILPFDKQLVLISFLLCQCRPDSFSIIAVLLFFVSGYSIIFLNNRWFLLPWYWQKYY